MEELVKYIACALVGNDNVTVTTTKESDKVSIITVSATKDDMGKIIGRNGKVANSIRTLVKSASLKSGIRYIVKINELSQN